MKYKNLFYTKEAEQAALLVAVGQSLESCYWQKGFCIFVFENNDYCQKIIVDYKDFKVRVEANALFKAIQTIEGIMALKHSSRL
jgi:Domain of unknown function (DUF5659)